jgi:4-amino-4-deoxy-L-arabinose transferase-like glycosyltransferase
LLRLFNSDFGGQIAWLLPVALVGLAVGLLVRWRTPRIDLRRAAYLMWGGWLLVHALVFSLMAGIVHTYYAVALAPAIGALVGAGAVELWSLRRAGGRTGLVATLALAASVAGTALLAAVLLARPPDFAPWLVPVVLGAGAIAAVGLLLPVAPRLGLAAATLGLATILAGPAAYAVETMNTAYSSGDPQAGPATAAAFGGPGGSQFSPIGGRFGPPSGQSLPGAGQSLPGAGGAGVSSQLIAFLEANKGDATWLVAVSSAGEAAPIQLATGDAVMAVGGFNGSDAALTVDQLQAYVESGQLRYYLVGGNGGANAFGGSASALTTWVTQHGTVVESVGGGQLYDLSPTG